MEFAESYVYTHGQGEVAFVFLFARLPTDAKVQSCLCTQLYRTDVGMQYSNSNLQSVVTRTINWNLIDQR
ncbi:hypothetical protein [Bacillus cereus]|uniref:hypothetical protein n=1 Tax=Bacillus cereus TaxID=1396 RepID=UPI001C551101|nr:hypothetical protein [Bacillus cereus]